jgi:chromosomal replication initiation ATPase DnaA
MAILYAKREARGEELDEESMTLIAQTITDNIRELEGVTNTLITKKQYL